MSKPRKHAELIKAWADGAEIEYRFCSTDKWEPIFTPSFLEDAEYRIRPEEKKPVVRWLWADINGRINGRMLTEEEQQNLFTFQNIKLEWSRTEFPE